MTRGRKVLRSALAALVGCSIMATLPAPSPMAQPVNGHADEQSFRNIAVGFKPSGVSARITAPTARIYGLSKIAPNQPVVLADGSMSPADTYYLQVRKFAVDDLTMSFDRPDHRFALTNNNGSNHTLAFAVGNDSKSTRVGLWITVASLKLCITVDTLNTLIMTYAGVFGGRLDEVLNLVQTIFRPYTASPLQRVGPCVPIKELLPLLSVLLDAGVPVPDELPVVKADVNVVAGQVTAGHNERSITAPLARVEVTQ